MCEGRATFREEQRFRLWWAWFLLAAASGFAWSAFIYQVIAGKEFDDRPAPDWLIVLIWLLVGLGLPLLFISARLVVEVRGEGIRFRYYPFHRRWHEIARADILRAEARTYRPILEYGGWGIRWARGGKAYNVSGNRGVQLEMVGGKKVLFGSQRADELAAAITRMTES